MKLADTAESLASNSIPGLLRSAPDLGAHIGNIESMFTTEEGSLLLFNSALELWMTS